MSTELEKYNETRDETKIFNKHSDEQVIHELKATKATRFLETLAERGRM